MPAPAPQLDQVIQKLRTLPLERVSEVEDFIEFLSQKDKDRQLVHAAQAASEPVLQQVWDNPDDADYDRL
jgi:hypothetical protein